MIRYDMQTDDDCLRACVETILQCPGDVPHFVEDELGWYDALCEWARHRGLEAEIAQADRVIPRGVYICVGDSPRHEQEVGHAVLMKDRRLFHDPYTKTRAGLRVMHTVISFTLSDVVAFNRWRESL